MNIPENQTPIFPKGDQAPADYFTGTAWVKMLVLNNPTFNSAVANVVFEPGCRNNWHSHPGGQILIVTDGTGYYQEKGEPARLITKGDVITIAPNLVHWHGATAHSGLTHLAISTNTQKGIVDWLEPVTDQQYQNL